MLAGVREEDEYALEKDSILKVCGVAASMFDDVQQTFDMVLAGNPSKFPCATGTSVCVFNTRAGLLPAMTFYYTLEKDRFSETIVLLLVELRSGLGESSEVEVDEIELAPV